MPFGLPHLPAATPTGAAPAVGRLATSRTTARTILMVSGCALVLHVVWLLVLAGTGGDLAAQDAWTSFALAHPSSAYDLAWYGGMHPASYSLISPYVMSLVGVRTTMLVVGTVSTALVTLLLGQLRSLADPTWASVYAALALAGNAVSGRVTFGLGLLFGLAAFAVVFAWPRDRLGPRARVVRAVLAALLAALATA